MTKRYFKFITVLTSLFFTVTCFSQSVSISNDPVTPDTTAILDVNSTTKGLLVPRMTAQQRTAISTPATGLLVYQKDGDAGFYYFDGTAWFLLINNTVTDRQKTLLYTVQGF